MYRALRGREIQKDQGYKTSSLQFVRTGELLLFAEKQPDPAGYL